MLPHCSVSRVQEASSTHPALLAIWLAGARCVPSRLDSQLQITRPPPAPAPAVFVVGLSMPLRYGIQDGSTASGETQTLERSRATGSWEGVSDRQACCGGWALPQASGRRGGAAGPFTGARTWQGGGFGRVNDARQAAGGRRMGPCSHHPRPSWPATPGFLRRPLFHHCKQRAWRGRMGSRRGRAGRRAAGWAPGGYVGGPGAVQVWQVWLAVVVCCVNAHRDGTEPKKLIAKHRLGA